MDVNLKKLGAVVGLSVKDGAPVKPPASQADGDRHLVPAAATGIPTGFATDARWSPVRGLAARAANAVQEPFPHVPSAALPHPRNAPNR